MKRILEKMNKRITIGLLLLTVVALVGIPGALAAVDYSTSVQPIFNTKCNICHPTAGVSLSSYTATMTSTWSGVLIVTPGNAPNSILYQSIAGLPITGGGIAMPIGGTMTAAEIQSIGDWINQGALAAAPPPDTTPPTVTISSPVSGSTVNTATVTVSGTATDAVGVTSLTVNGAPVTITSGTSISYSTTVTLVSGLNTITVVAKDAAGNSGTATATITLDNILPTVSITSPTNGQIVSTPTITVSGTASDNVGVTSLTVNGAPVTLVAGAYSTTVTLVSGSNTITVVAKDAAGNSRTATVTVTLDNTKPAVTITSPVSGSTVNTPTVTVSGTATDAVGVTSLTVNGNPVTITPGTSVSYSTTVTLVSGLNTITVVAKDAAGNSGTATSTVTFTPPDTTAPTVTITSPTNGQIISTQTVTVSGTATDAVGVTSLTVNGTPVTITPGTSVSYSTAVTLKAGSNIITVIAKDAAGNSGTATVTVTFNPPDITAPTVTITSPVSGTTVNTSAVTVSGTATDSVGVTSLTVNGAPVTFTPGTSVSYSTSVTLVSGLNTITVVAKDAAGNSGTATVTVTSDTTPPVITILGANPVNVTQNTVYTDAGATALDAVDGVVPVTSVSSVNTAVIGKYTVTYTAIDKSGNKATAVRTVNVVAPPDTTPPVITILGANPVNVTQNTVYTDAGATALDAVDGVVPVTSVSTVNTAVIGTYAVTYTAKDKAGNVATAIRTVNVVALPDTVPPVITILGANPVNVTQNTVYTDAGATALDAVDGVVAVTSVSTVNTAVIGTYTVTYTAIDKAGNKATAIRTVNVVALPPPADTTPPVITILGSNPVNVIQNTVYTDAGATALDAVDGVVPVTSVSTVNTAVIGTYTVTYTAKDKAGNVATAIRTVNVVAPPDTTPPVITILGANPVNVTQNTVYTDAGATALDAVDGVVPVTSVSTVNTAVIGTYAVTYTAKDVAGNVATTVRTVNVVAAPPADITPPVVTITLPTDGSIVNTPTVTVTGTASDNVGVISLTVNGAPATIVAGAYSTTVTLVSGLNTITAVATDGAGNSGTATVTVTFNPPPPPPVGQTFSISGFKINGRTDTVISGWGITLTNGTITQTTLTGTDGMYTFSNLVNGIYTVTEENRPGWRALGAKTLTVTINGADVSNQNFTNVQKRDREDRRNK